MPWKTKRRKKQGEMRTPSPLSQKKRKKGRKRDRRKIRFFVKRKVGAGPIGVLNMVTNVPIERHLACQTPPPTRSSMAATSLTVCVTRPGTGAVASLLVRMMAPGEGGILDVWARLAPSRDFGVVDADEGGIGRGEATVPPLLGCDEEEEEDEGDDEEEEDVDDAESG